MKDSCNRRHLRNFVSTKIIAQNALKVRHKLFLLRQSFGALFPESMFLYFIMRILLARSPIISCYCVKLRFYILRFAIQKIVKFCFLELIFIATPNTYVAPNVVLCFYFSSLQHALWSDFCFSYVNFAGISLIPLNSCLMRRFFVARENSQTATSSSQTIAINKPTPHISSHDAQREHQARWP